MTELAHPAADLGSIHPAIDHALRAFAPEQAMQAAAAIRCACPGRVGSADPEAWRGSRLTGDGFPLEIGFSTADSGLRLTLQPGSRRTALRERLESAATAAATVGGMPVPAPTLAGLRDMQAIAPLAYGSWLGLRFSADGTNCKLYAEVPRNAAFRVRSFALAERKVAPRMIAYSPSTNVFEAYCRVPSLEPRHLPAVLGLVDAEDRASWLLEVIERAHGHRVRGRLPGPTVGVSFLRNASERRVTLYFHARSIWGSDAVIRRGFSKLARGAGWDDTAYLRVTSTIAQRDDWRTYHGLLGITIDPSQRISFAIGVRPVAE